MKPKRLVLFVEGQGDSQAVPILVKKILKEIDPWEYLHLDEVCVRIGKVGNITGRHAGNWLDKLNVACKRQEVGGVLLVLDGDQPFVLNDLTLKKESFCAVDVARRLAKASGQVRGGERFSIACVFARLEFESWLLAGAESLCGKPLPDGRPGVKANAPLPDSDTDLKPDAKSWFNNNMAYGYKPTIDQELLTQMVSLESIRERNPKSYRRLENAITQLCEAIKSGKHIASPQ